MQKRPWLRWIAVVGVPALIVVLFFWAPPAHAILVSLLVIVIGGVLGLRRLADRGDNLPAE